MKAKFIGSCVFALMASQGAHAQSSAKTVSMSDRENLMHLHEAITKSAHENPSSVNWDEFVQSHYADDAILMPPNAGPAEGQQAIAGVFKSFPSLTKFQTSDVEVVTSGSLGYIRGTYELGMKLDNGEQMNDQGKYIEVWQKDKRGHWKCIRDIFNSSMPAPQK